MKRSPFVADINEVESVLVMWDRFMVVCRDGSVRKFRVKGIVLDTIGIEEDK